MAMRQQQDRSWWTAVSVLVLTLLGVSVLGGGMMGWGMMGPGMMGWAGGSGVQGISGWGAGLSMALGLLGMLAFWGVLIVGGVLAMRALSGSSGTAMAPREDALDIVKRRYAAGELSNEQYQEMRRALAE